MENDFSIAEKNRLRQNTIAGVGWSAVGQIAKLVFQFIISVILARMLAPRDFGLIGMVVVITGFVALFGELGFSAALIQKESAEERHYSTIFWLNLAAGIVLTVLVMAFATVVAEFYTEPRLSPLTRIISLNILINSMSLVHKTILTRRMNFRTLILIETTTMIVAGFVAIFFALMGYGAWSLVWQILIASSLSAAMFWWRTGWRPQFLFDRSAAVDLLGFSTNLLGFNVLNYWTRSGDKMLIGKFIGSVGLGIYSRAYDIMLLPLNQISSVLTRVMFPTLSRVQNNKLLVKRTYLRAISMIALLTFPMMMGLLVVAEHFVLALYGSAWAEVIPVLKILCLLGMVQSISATVGWIYQSQGRTDWFFRWGLVTGVLFLGSISVGIIIGTVKAVAISYALLSGVILLYPVFAIPGRLIEMTFGDVIKTVAGILLCAGGMALFVWGIGFLLPTDWPHWAYLAVQVPIGAIAYLTLIHFFRLRAYRDIRHIITDLVRNRSFTATDAASP